MVAVNGIYKLAVIGTVAGQQHIHTLHFRSTLAGNSVTMAEDAWMTDLITTWQTTPATTYRALFRLEDQPVINFQVRKECGSVPLPAGVDASQPAGSRNGTFNATAVDPMAPWLASVTTVRTALAGRSRRGRYFIGGLQENQVTGATLTASYVALLQAYADALRAKFIAPLDTETNNRMFVWSKTLSLAGGGACQNYGADVSSLQVRDQLASMKSRKAGSGI